MVAKCLRDNKCDGITHYAATLANAASLCWMEYGAMGATGFVYASAKDACKAYGLKPKRWMHILRAIGQYMALSSEDWAKAKRENMTEGADIASALIAAFGDGKTKK